ncbi:MAG: flavin reductase family protein [Proteobacteria bacterium]|nr:flavin reductase family protein [Pseudomonadota bacterium]
MNSSLPRTATHPPQFSPREFRDALGMFATGVALLTARGADGQPLGMTINSFNSVSLQPPLVLWSLAQRSSLLEVLGSTGHCAIHVLTAEQRALAERFATRGIDRWAGVAHAPGLQGVPVIADAVAVFECRIRSQYAEGDHTIFVGEVLRCSHRQGTSPLLYHGGMFYTEHRLGRLSPKAAGPMG